MIPTARSAYLESTVKTASPAQLLLMLCDRLVLDCRRATEALRTGDHPAAHLQFLHAQDIVTELHSSLRPSLWDGADGLSALYGHLQVSLVQANIRRDVELADHCLDISSRLAETWREAALQSAMATA